MLIAVIVLSLLVLAGFGFLLGAVGRLSLNLTGLADQITAEATENVLQHRITRGYVGGELLEKRLMPHLGYREPQKTEIELIALAAWKSEVTDREAS
jgi:hypothetical protein